MSFHYLLGDGQANACARVFISSVQTLEYGENSIKELRINAYTIILHRKDPLIALCPGRDMNLRARMASKLDSIAYEILEELDHLHLIGYNSRQLIVGHRRPALFNCYLQIHYRL